MTDAKLKALLRQLAIEKYGPLTPEEAQHAYEEAVPIPLSDERIQEIVDYAVGRRSDHPQRRKP